MLPTNVVSKKLEEDRGMGSRSLSVALAIGSRVKSRETRHVVWQAAETAKRRKTKLESKLLGKILAVPGQVVCTTVCV